MAKENKSILFEESSGNVFADLELDDADELYARGLMGLKVLELLRERGLKKQKEIAAHLAIKQPEVSLLVNGEFNRFSEARLMGFLKKLACYTTKHKRPTPHVKGG